jgi:hypothetical protein
MLRITRNELFIGFAMSVILSLFANFALMVQRYGLMINAATYKMAPSEPNHEMGKYELLASLGWFFFFSFAIFIIYILLYRWGNRIFRQKETKTLGLAIGISLLVACGLFKAYPAVYRATLSKLHDPASVHVTQKQMVSSGRTVYLYKQTDSIPTETADEGYVGLMKVIPDANIHPLLIEHTFVALTVLLVMLLIHLSGKRQEMKLEYEKMKVEQLQNSYNALMGQINPHFFFNSLNGLNSLIRAGEQDKTIEYLDGLSNVFRYILQSNRKTLVSLDEELQFTKAYTYLLSVRYEHKLFFSIQVEEIFLKKKLPILSLLPLIENAVKHNIISKQHPLQVSIYTKSGNWLVISNPIQPKLEENVCSGIGLKNLQGRYQMLTGKSIEVSEIDGHFDVSLPLTDTPK